MAAGVSSPGDLPSRPWLKIRGTDDATTLWFAVLRRQEKGIFIGSLVLRHGDHHALLLSRGWEEVSVEEIRAGYPDAPADGEADAASGSG